MFALLFLCLQPFISICRFSISITWLLSSLFYFTFMYLVSLSLSKLILYHSFFVEGMSVNVLLQVVIAIITAHRPQ